MGSRGTVLVTGASRGIGRAVATRLAHEGYALVLAARDSERIVDTVRACGRAPAARAVLVDVRDESHVRRLRAVLDEVPDLVSVVNNAGIGKWAPIEELSLEAWDAQLETNLRGAFLVIRETLPYLRRGGHGLYVNVASDASLVGKPSRAAYNASKFGLVGLTASLRAELTAAGIDATLLFAGPVNTSFRDHQPGDRPGALQPEDVAEVVAFVIGSYPRLVVNEVTVMPRGHLVTGPRSLV